MVDVTPKEPTHRRAIARCKVFMKPETTQAITNREVKKGDVKVRVEDGVLYISGERNFEKGEKSKRYHRIERAYGLFTRSFTLPDDVDTQEVHAEFKDGVLNVRMLKDKNAKPKMIEVKVA